MNPHVRQSSYARKAREFDQPPLAKVRLAAMSRANEGCVARFHVGELSSICAISEAAIEEIIAELVGLGVLESCSTCTALHRPPNRVPPPYTSTTSGRQYT